MVVALAGGTSALEEPDANRLVAAGRVRRGAPSPRGDGEIQQQPAARLAREAPAALTETRSRGCRPLRLR
jgi:hypothetical protein